MAIKAFEISFLVSTEEMLAMVAHRNLAVRVHALSDGKSHLAKPQLRIQGGTPTPKLLPSPGHHDKATRARKGHHVRGRDEHGNYAIAWKKMLQAFAHHPEHTKSTRDLGPVLERLGLKRNSVSPQVAMMQKKGWLRRLEPGIYQLTAKGAVEAGRQGFHVASRRVKPKGHKAKPKPVTPTEPTTIAPEASNG